MTVTEINGNKIARTHLFKENGGYRRSHLVVEYEDGTMRVMEPTGPKNRDEVNLDNFTMVETREGDRYASWLNTLIVNRGEKLGRSW